MSPTTTSGHSLVNQQVMDHTDENHAVIILQAKAGDNKRTPFCNYLVLEGLEEQNFQTFRNKAIKLLSNIQSKVEKSGCQPQQQTISQSLSATSTCVPQTFQQLH